MQPLTVQTQLLVKRMASEYASKDFVAKRKKKKKKKLHLNAWLHRQQ